MFGAGVSSSEGLVGSFNVTQANFLGTGNKVSAQVNTGSVNKTYALNVLEPYYTPDGISRNYSVYRKDTNTSSLNIVSYNTSSYGAGLYYGVPLDEKNSISYGVTIDNTQVSNLQSGISPQRYIDYCGSVTGNTLTTSCTMNSLNAILSWANDTGTIFCFQKKGSFRGLAPKLLYLV